MDPIISSSVVRIDPEIHHGDACFDGTRVPVALLFAYLAHGDTLDEFLENYPTVTREQVRTLLMDIHAHAESLSQRVPA